MNEKPDATAQLYAALAKAQGAFSPIKKDRDGQVGHQKFKFADFDQLIAATRPALIANGLAVIQLIKSGADGASIVETMLVHESGASVASTVTIARPNFERVQDFGKLISYLRRYAYSAILCLAADDDDDSAQPLQAGGARQETTAAGERPTTADELPEYPQEAFDKRLDERRKRIESGELTPQQIIAMIETKSRLTKSQRETLLALGGPQE